MMALLPPLLVGVGVGVDVDVGVLPTGVAVAVAVDVGISVSVAVGGNSLLFDQIRYNIGRQQSCNRVDMRRNFG